MVIQLVVFLLEGQRYALSIATVVRIVRAVEVTPLPGAPGIVFGVISLQGDVIPVLNVRRRFQLSGRAIGVADQFIIARTDQRTVALVVDDVNGVIEREQADVMTLERIAPGLEQFQGVAKFEDGLVLIYDLDKFLFLDEACTLDEAMDRSK